MQVAAIALAVSLARTASMTGGAPKRKPKSGSPRSGSPIDLIDDDESSDGDAGQTGAADKQRRLQPGKWLSESIIEDYLKRLKASNTSERFYKVWFADSRFVRPRSSKLSPTRLAKREADRTKRLRKEMSGCDKLAFPCHQNNHWTLAVVDMHTKRFYHFDSYMQGSEERGNYFFREVQKYLNPVLGESFALTKEECKKVGGVWTCGGVRVPQQQNAHDCGVFVLSMAEAIQRLEFQTQRQIGTATFRNKIADAIGVQTEEVIVD